MWPPPVTRYRPPKAAKPFPLREALRAACPGGKAVDGPDLGPDLPQLPGFPEGRPFRITGMATAGAGGARA